MTGLRIAGVLLAAGLLGMSGGCKQKAPDDGPAKTVQRTDYAPEEFGIGRQHTPDPSCNREIDRLLDEVRLCYQSGGTPATCETLQQKNTGRINRLKNTVRCAR